MADSTVPRRQLGRLLKQFRVGVGITLDDAAASMEYSRQKIWRLETGASPVRALDVKALCELYDVSTDMIDVLMGLAAETKSRGWWHAYGDVIPHWFSLFVGLEESASRMRMFDESLIPGLLQTREYARAVLGSSSMDHDERERVIDVRLQRQAILSRRVPPQLDVILSEAVLCRTAGLGMTEQLHHLCERGHLPNVTIRVLPLHIGPHPGAVAGSFVILDFARDRSARTAAEPSTVYSEALTGALYLDKPDEVRAHASVWASLETLALDEEQSHMLITKMVEVGSHA